MSKIDDLIQELCSNGVLWEKIGDLAIVGTGRSNEDEADDNGKYPFFIESQTVRYKKSYEYNEEAILVPSEGNIGDIFHYINGKYALHQRVYRICFQDKKIVTKFVYHYMKVFFRTVILKKTFGATVTSIRKHMIEEFWIPIPPIEVQFEIVRILDDFEEHIAEISKELMEKRKQYERIKEKRLFECNESKKYKLHELAFYSEDEIDFSQLNENNYIGIDDLLQNKVGKKRSKCVPKEGKWTGFRRGDVLIGNIRPYLKKIWLSDCNGGTNGDVLVIRKKDNGVLYNKYLYYLLSSDRFFDFYSSCSKGAEMPEGDKEMVMKFECPVPSLNEQRLIVKILDMLSESYNGIIKEITAKIESKKEYYEFLRTKLLTFDMPIYE